MLEKGRRFIVDLIRKPERRFVVVTTSFLSGLLLLAGGVERPATDTFNSEMAKCRRVITHVDPLEYSLQTMSDVCIWLDQGESSTQVIAKIQAQLDHDRPFRQAATVAGTFGVIGGLLGGVTPALRRSFKNRSRY